MKNILIAGGTGLVGIHLSRILKDRGYNVMHLSRKPQSNGEFQAFAWDIDKGMIDEKAFQEADYIINLAGSGIADKRWTEARKKDIIDSRVNSTRLLKKYLTNMPHKVKAYLSASAIGYYGDRKDELLSEESPSGTGFLTESTVAWEDSIQEIAQTGMRTIAVRIGIVLSTEGGALPQMLIPFMFRLGVYFGDGEQWFSWIHIDDLCNIFVWAIEKDKTSGIYNGVAPQPLNNYDLTKAISKAKGGGYLMFPAPAFMLRLFMGEMADVVLNSSRVSSKHLENTGFHFKYPEAVTALKDIFQRKV